MKKRKLQWLLTIVLFAGVAILAIAMHRHIVASSTGPENLEARDDSLASACGMIAGSGLVLIWLLPFAQKLRSRIREKISKS